ncbi:MAG TPA: maleylacetoacetate isomerase [Steroidobacteraceae bacterium]|nr:maleylacetoacetate isomerase [Steroidobacteraceae bacterium]
MKLYTMWRSSAAYRVRIALNVKGLVYQSIPKKFATGEHRSPEYTALNPQGLIPALEDGGAVISQSLAIIEYLDETHRAPPLLPADPFGRAMVRSMAQAIACDIHPLNNLRVRNYLRGPLHQDEGAVQTWSRHWIGEGFRGLEEQARRFSTDGRHLYGAGLTLADICLVPQIYNARRVDCDLSAFPTLVAISAALEAQPAFSGARPEAQPDAA